MVAASRRRPSSARGVVHRRGSTEKTRMKKRKAVDAADCAGASEDDDLFGMALALPEFKCPPAPAPKKPPAPPPSVDTVTYRSVTSYGAAAPSASLHPIDRHRALTKSLAQIKQQKLDKKNAKSNVGGGDNRLWNRRKSEPLPKVLPKRARGNEAMASTHRAAQS